MSAPRMTPARRLAGAFTADADARRQQQPNGRASAHRHDPQLERVLELREENPAAYASLPLRRRLAAAMYADTKAAADGSAS